MRPSFEPALIARCRAQLSYLETVYPGFQDWFDRKVIPGVETGTRFLDVVEIAGTLAGIVIAKDEDGEKKLCTVWVHPDYRGRGIGIRMIGKACFWLGTDRPFASVSEVNHVPVDQLLRKLGFLETSSKVNPGTGLIEHYYNEPTKEITNAQNHA